MTTIYPDVTTQMLSKILEVKPPCKKWAKKVNMMVLNKLKTNIETKTWEHINKCSSCRLHFLACLNKLIKIAERKMK